MNLPTSIKQLTSLAFSNPEKAAKSQPFTYLPELFLIMAIVTVGCSLYTMKLHQQMEDMIRLTTWHLQLKKDYSLALYNKNQATPHRTDQIIREVQNNLQIMLRGGAVLLPGDTEPIYVQKATEPLLKQEIQRRLRIYKDLQADEAKLSLTEAHTVAYHQKQQEINTLLSQLEYPHPELVTLYIKELHQHSRQLAWLELSTILLLALLGVLMTRQQKTTLQKLAESDKRFREIFRVSPVGKMLVDLGGKIQGVNESFQNLLGYNEAELLQQPIRILYGDDITETEKKLYESLLNQEVSSFEIEKSIRHRDGHTLWVIISVAMMYDIKQQPSLIVVQAQNITDLKDMQEALRISESRYRTIIESAMDGIVVADMDNTIVSTNQQVNRIFGYEPGALIGKKLILLIPPIYREAHLKGMQRVKETHQSRLNGKLLELQGLKQNGDTFPLELSLSTWEGGEGTMMATAIIRDITARKQFQRESEALILSNKSLEEFTVIASHDLQEPLRKIAFYTERFSKREGGQLQEESKMDMQRLLGGVSRMQDLIRALSEYSRVTPQNPQFEPIDLNLLLHSITFELKAELKQAGGSINIDPMPIIEADETQMEILFRNLIQNALKFRRDGVCPKIHIYGSLMQYQLKSYEVPMLEISVQDNGIGFNEKYLDRIFKVFQRLHSTSKFSGTGIGLATCKKIVELHHGHITAKSQPGEGSTFIISLPIYQN